MESSLPSQNDRDTGAYTTCLDVWYGLQVAVRKFAEWTKSRMDFLTEHLEDAEFKSVAAALQLPEDAKVKPFTLSINLFASQTCRLFYSCYLECNFAKFKFLETICWYMHEFSKRITSSILMPMSIRLYIKVIV